MAAPAPGGMTEDEARVEAGRIAPDAIVRLAIYADRLLAENRQQNVIARSTEPQVWSRHLLDALQLTAFARPEDRSWLDIGSGPGLPGIVLAIAGRWQVTLVEPRRRRVDFLQRVIDELQLDNATVLATTGEKVTGHFDLVTARAVASIDALFAMTGRCADERTRFILPKGRSAQSDVDAARSHWHGVFHVEQSSTDPSAGIVLADRVRPR
jgi:16S rRNA (guanine527-N7)-methyltransferase